MELVNLRPRKKTYKSIKNAYKIIKDLGYLKKNVRKSVLSKYLKN